jgi:polyvinyl alcohol dehydrogenase (cytochrome)
LKISMGYRSIVAALLVLFSGELFSSASDLDQNLGPRVAQWQSAGQNISNTREQPNEKIINPSNVENLKVKWVFTTGADISATPTVGGDTVFVVDWAGFFYAIQKDTGKEIWRHQISEYDHNSGAMSRTSPLILDREVVIGDNVIDQTSQHNGANLIAVDRSSGSLKWITQVDDHPAAIITGAPLAFNDIIYVGVSSIEEELGDVPGYKCCTFRGSIVAVNAKTGRILWKFYTVPDNGGATDEYSGGAVFQTPAIDPGRGLLYVGTGNNYTTPAEVGSCEELAIADQDPNPNACTPPDDHFDSVLALDLRTGRLKWSRKVKGYDTWISACSHPMDGVTCPSPAGPDYDFGGSGPNLIGNIIGIGQKSGMYWAFDPDNGKIIWSTIVGPGGTLGGIEWGTATDGKRVYVPIANKGATSYKLTPNGPNITWGSWAALDVNTGKIIWQIADPTVGAIDTGAASVANGVLYVGSYSGTMYAIDARNGNILWSFASGGSVIDGPSIVDGVVYWASGYKRYAPGTPNNKVCAFDLPGKN